MNYFILAHFSRVRGRCPPHPLVSRVLRTRARSTRAVHAVTIARAHGLTAHARVWGTAYGYSSTDALILRSRVITQGSAMCHFCGYFRFASLAYGRSQKYHNAPCKLNKSVQKK